MLAEAQGDASLAVELVRDDAALAALREDWRALERAAGNHNPFLSWSWTMACRAHIRPGDELFVLVARAGDGRMVGVAPLCVERTLGLRVLRFVADGRSDYLGFLTDPGVDGAERRLLEHLADLAGAWDVAVLRHLTADYAALDPADMPARCGRARSPARCRRTSRSRATGTRWSARARADRATRGAGSGVSRNAAGR